MLRLCFLHTDGNVQGLLFERRWSNLGSLAHYLQEAMSALVWAKISIAALPIVNAALSFFGNILEAPSAPLQELAGAKMWRARFNVAFRAKLRSGGRRRRVVFSFFSALTRVGEALHPAPPRSAKHMVVESGALLRDPPF